MKVDERRRLVVRVLPPWPSSAVGVCGFSSADDGDELVEASPGDAECGGPVRNDTVAENSVSGAISHEQKRAELAADVAFPDRLSGGLWTRLSNPVTTGNISLTTLISHEGL